jgi:hypothetical protein
MIIRVSSNQSGNRDSPELIEDITHFHVPYRLITPFSFCRK